MRCAEFLDIGKFNTFTQTTPTGGVHLLFQYDEEVKQTQTIDIRKDGGYSVSSVRALSMANATRSSTTSRSNRC
jgi:hypothetical protein